MFRLRFQKIIIAFLTITLLCGCSVGAVGQALNHGAQSNAPCHQLTESDKNQANDDCVHCENSVDRPLKSEAILALKLKQKITSLNQQLKTKHLLSSVTDDEPPPPVSHLVWLNAFHHPLQTWFFRL